MNAAEFSRRRARIELDCHGRGKRYNRQLAHLITDARAVLVVMERKVVGYRLPNDEMVCIKTRYRTMDAANADILRINTTNISGSRVPVRAYYCAHCRGFHATSQARLAS